jgi:dihydroorotate dehydrogenase electron transfer subunit
MRKPHFPNCRMKNQILQHRPRVVSLLKIVEETPTVKSLIFRDELSAHAEPGQFDMIWVPGVDEIPMSLLPSTHGSTVKITVKKRGDGSRGLLQMMKGDLIGVRGPYGKGFTHKNEKKALLIGGGTGTVPLVAVLRNIAKRHTQCSFILGAKTRRELLFVDEIKQLTIRTGGEFSITTDDGSRGRKGLATDEAERLIQPSSFDRIYTCGPEPMMKKTVDLATHASIPAEAGLERIFKCGSGICGSCCIGPYLVCKDGPVFNSATLGELSEFGKSMRSASGRAVPI